MALRSLIQLRGFLEGLPGGSLNICPTDLQNNTPPSFTIQDILANGDNTIVVPALADGCIIIFDPTSVVTKKIKGVGGDTGIVVSKDKWMVLTFDATPPTNFIINCSAADTGKYTTIIFF
jgi:hypothetical protein